MYMLADSQPMPITSPVIQNGLCYMSFAYDAARSIDLGEAERRIHQATERPSIAHKRRTPSYFEYQPPPLRTSRDTEPFVVGKLMTRSSVDLMIYDFGAVSVIYALPIEGPFEDLLFLSEELYDNEALLRDSRLQVDQLLKVVGNAASQAHPSPVVEDYVVFHVERFAEPPDLKLFCVEYARQAYETLSRRSWSLPWIFGSYGADLRSLAELQVDNATLFEGVNNTLKLVGDQYLARVYRMVNRRFHLDEWDSSILRKLQTLESIYEKISNQASNRRTEMLEWVIIFLIAFSIVVGFIH